MYLLQREHNQKQQYWGENETSQQDALIVNWHHTRRLTRQSIFGWWGKERVVRKKMLLESHLWQIYTKNHIRRESILTMVSKTSLFFYESRLLLMHFELSANQKRISIRKPNVTARAKWSMTAKPNNEITHSGIKHWLGHSKISRMGPTFDWQDDDGYSMPLFLQGKHHGPAPWKTTRHCRFEK